tara:strand:+ start:2108 stop:2245 length:138 start_codon:yes stop_codon:yes gene_type:complete
VRVNRLVTGTKYSCKEVLLPLTPSLQGRGGGFSDAKISSLLVGEE